MVGKCRAIDSSCALLSLNLKEVKMAKDRLIGSETITAVRLSPMKPSIEELKDDEKLSVLARHEYMRQCGVIDSLAECFIDCNDEFEVAFSDNLIIIKVDERGDNV